MTRRRKRGGPHLQVQTSSGVYLLGFTDGFHLASHARALGVTLVRYRSARKHGASEAFAFGTGKVFWLAGHASAVALTLVAVQMMGESHYRLDLRVRRAKKMAKVPLGFFHKKDVASLQKAMMDDTAGLESSSDLRKS